jgi:hypothetical protein
LIAAGLYVLAAVMTVVFIQRRPRHRMTAGD